MFIKFTSRFRFCQIPYKVTYFQRRTYNKDYERGKTRTVGNGGGMHPKKLFYKLAAIEYISGCGPGDNDRPEKKNRLYVPAPYLPDIRLPVIRRVPALARA